MRERPRVGLFECVWPVTLGIGQNIDKVMYSVSGGRNILSKYQGYKVDYYFLFLFFLSFFFFFFFSILQYGCGFFSKSCWKIIRCNAIFLTGNYMTICLKRCFKVM